MITPMIRKLVAELVGTFILVFAGTGAIVINHESGGVITHVGVALTFGLVVFALIQMLGDVSGAHLNPAVTTGFVLARRFPPQEAIPYITAQCLGAFLASGLLKILFPADTTLGATLPAGSAFQSFALEFTLTAILMLTILRATTGAPGKIALAGAAIGSVIALEAMFAGPACGASMNPARRAEMERNSMRYAGVGLTGGAGVEPPANAIGQPPAAAPALKPAVVDPATTALLLFDFTTQTCSTERRPRCAASISSRG